MKLSARDLARVGLLMARNGQWHDRPLVSATWVAESTTAYSTEPEGWQGYGYLWWVPQKTWPFWRGSPGSVSSRTATAASTCLSIGSVTS